MSSAESPSNLHTITSSTFFQELLSTDLSRVSLLNFWTPWAEPCKQMNEEVTKLAKQNPSLLTLNIEAEEQSEIAESFEIASVPTFIILRVRLLISLALASKMTHLGQINF